MDKTKLRILHLFGRMSRGGAELRTIDVIRNLYGSKVRHDFCSLSGLPGELDVDIRSLGGKVHLQRLSPSFPIHFLRLLAVENYDVVHSHVHLMSGLLLMLAAWAHVPVRIAHFRNTDDGSTSRLIRSARNNLLRRLINCYATQILAVCEGAMSSGWKTNWQADPRCRIVYNGFDESDLFRATDVDRVRQEFAIAEEEKICIHVGRFSPAKNHRRLISIFGALARKSPQTRLLLVGRGNNENERDIRALIESSELGNRTIFAGERADVSSLLQTADLMIFPSLWEGLPGAVIEACAIGLPVVASDLPGIQEIARHFDTITTLSLSDSDERWAETAFVKLGRNLSIPDARIAFRRTPFVLEQAAKTLAHQWGYSSC